ncbi:hypothetical protein [uncultured Paracoccus sp.]|uniref:hypothetical protein n=1 Tax=uncultured Paracoccus sp. TaxID=189685 RepID=UPI0025F78031|nr:hypothetical protein [uncultured Paracoccus sp.]
MNMTLNFLDVAGVIADVDRVPGKLVPTLLRRIRVFDTKNLIQVYREETGRREGRLDIVGACMARVHSELIDFGLDAETLRRLREFFDRGKDVGPSAFTSAIDAVKDGKPVTLEVALRQRPEPWNKWHAFRMDGHTVKSERATRVAAELDKAEGIVDRAVLTIDLQMLLGEFIKAFEFASATSQAED